MWRAMELMYHGFLLSHGWVFLLTMGVGRSWLAVKDTTMLGLLETGLNFGKLTRRSTRAWSVWNGWDWLFQNCCHVHSWRRRSHFEKNGMLVTSLQSALGRGYDQKRVRRQNDTNLQVNFAGHSFTTRFVLSTIPKTAYEAQPEVFHEAIDHVARSCSKLLRCGVADKVRGVRSTEWWFGSEGGRPISSESCTLLPVIQHYGEEGEERGQPKGCCPIAWLVQTFVLRKR